MSSLLTGCGRAVIGAVVLVAALASGEVAYAQSNEPTPAELRAAAEAFDRGREAYKEEKFAEAAEQFERADASAPSATALGLAIKARDKAGDLDRAGTLSALALERYPDDAEIQRIAPEVLGRAGAAMYEVRISCVEPCELADGTKIVHGAAAKQRTVFLAEGSHSMRAGFPDGRTQSKTVDATTGGSGQLAFEGPEAEGASTPTEPEPEPVVAPQPEPTQDEPVKKGKGLSPVVFFAGLGATAVAGGITIWSGLDTVNNPGVDRVKAECAPNDESCPAYKTGRAKQLRTNVLIGVTATLGVATGVLGAIGIDWGGSKSSSEEAKGLRVEPWVAVGDGASVGARGTF